MFRFFDTSFEASVSDVTALGRFALGTEAIHFVQIQSDISMRNHSFLVLVLLLVVGVFGVDTDVVKSVSVMEGDSVTLHTNLTEIQTDWELKWKIQDDTIIAEIDGETNIMTVPGNKNGFEGRLKLNKTTGSLTITNIKTTDSGVYKLKISGKNLAESEFSVTVRGVFSDDGVKKMSAKKGESVILQTEIISIPDNVIEWTFGPQDTALFKTDRQKKTPRYNEDDVKFKDRLHLDTKSGDLTVKNINSEVSGLYKVKIIKRTHTLQKIFSVTLYASHRISGSAGTGVSVICVAIVLACAVAVCYWKKRKQSGKMYDDDDQWS
ncbi:coxsackievirus and adenovirus receptor homolog [Chanodichthys erythropterus]|uniref:coxsackievirus and adenovirus receptor homolog n=1 Tax=Chanodichthys erythropterus TaxID=933992 RepID=UPI00351E8CA9